MVYIRTAQQECMAMVKERCQGSKTQIATKEQVQKQGQRQKKKQGTQEQVEGEETKNQSSKVSLRQQAYARSAIYCAFIKVVPR